MKSEVRVCCVVSEASASVVRSGVGNLRGLEPVLCRALMSILILLSLARISKSESNPLLGVL